MAGTANNPRSQPITPQSQGRGEGRGGNRRPHDRNNRDQRRDDTRRSGPSEPREPRAGKQADGQKQAQRQRGEKQLQAPKQDKQLPAAPKPQVQAQAPKSQQAAKQVEKVQAPKPAADDTSAIAALAAPAGMDDINTLVGSPVDDQILIASQVPADAAATDDANGDGGNKRRRGRRGGRRRRRGAGEAGGIAGEDGMLDQDGASDEALNADGSQPEFDFDDIEAPAKPKAAAASPVATSPVAETSVAQAPAEMEATAAAIPSPAIEAADAVVLALEASEAAPAPAHADLVDVWDTPADVAEENRAVASMPVQAEPMFTAAPAASAASPDSITVAPASDTVAAFEPGLEPVAVVADAFVEPLAEPVMVPEPAVAAVMAEAPAAAFEAEPVVVEIDPTHRAEQLRGLFDTARVAPEGNQAVTGREHDIDGTSRNS